MSIVKREKTIKDVKKEDLRYAVFYEGYLQHYINPNLLLTCGIVENSEIFEELKSAQIKRIQIFHEMEKTNEPSKLIALDNLFTANEFHLQELWGFKKDEKYHRFWESSKCTCPKLDNEDKYPYGNYSISTTCPIHGHRINKS